MASRNRISRLIARCTPHRRVPHTPPLRDTVPPPPWWVRAFTAIGRPKVAVIVLIMCAPGEHHLAVLAGWDTRLAWGMAAVLAAYAGIATAVADARPAGAPGKKSADRGAVLALLLAMAAQPVSHLFVTGHWTATPRAPMWLVIVVSCVPPLVLGHLFHLAATPVPRAGQAGTVVPQAGGQPRRVPRRFVATGRVVLPGPTAIPVSVPVVLAPSAAASRAVTEPRRKARTTAQVAEDHGVKPDTVRKWVARGILTPLPERDSGGGHLFAPDATPKLSVATG
ncbi:hypothetical protein [Embleya sp. NPDC005971]|uniref:hypothetical protein n=1 Tax=Embleya sp. NPDC005971 TaxID=3156724 RepID=UPI0033EEDFCA